jgi:hypothetical protein
VNGPYGFELNENCQTRKLRSNGFFCQLPRLGRCSVCGREKKPCRYLGPSLLSNLSTIARRLEDVCMFNGRFGGPPCNVYT